MAKILKIDDEPCIRDLLDRLPRRKEYDVVLGDNRRLSCLVISEGFA